MHEIAFSHSCYRTSMARTRIAAARGSVKDSDLATADANPFVLKATASVNFN